MAPALLELGVGKRGGEKEELTSACPPRIDRTEPWIALDASPPRRGGGVTVCGTVYAFFFLSSVVGSPPFTPPSMVNLEPTEGLSMGAAGHDCKPSADTAHHEDGRTLQDPQMLRPELLCNVIIRVYWGG